MNQEEQIIALQQEVLRLQKDNEEIAYMLSLKEEEITEWKEQPDSVPALYSKLQERLYDFEHLQQVIEKMHRLSHAAERREASIEDQLIRQLSIESLYDELKNKYRSVQVSIEDIRRDLNEAMELYQTLAVQQQQIAEWRSKWELAQLDLTFLQEKLSAIKNPVIQ